MILSKEKNPTKHVPFMTTTDVKELVEKNFSIFQIRATGKYFSIVLTKKQKGIIKYFMNQF